MLCKGMSKLFMSRMLNSKAGNVEPRLRCQTPGV